MPGHFVLFNQMGTFFAPGLFARQKLSVLRLELFDPLDQQVQLGRKSLQVDVFHGSLLVLGEWAGR